jgi:hypothetical protein
MEGKVVGNGRLLLWHLPSASNWSIFCPQLLASALFCPARLGIRSATLTRTFLLNCPKDPWCWSVRYVFFRDRNKVEWREDWLLSHFSYRTGQIVGMTISESFLLVYVLIQFAIANFGHRETKGQKISEYFFCHQFLQKMLGSAYVPRH